MVTFSGSIVAFGKLSGKISGNPLVLPAKHSLNLLMVVIIVFYCYQFVTAETINNAMNPLLIMLIISFLFGVHLVASIGGADMPVVVSMLNSYSGWAASVTGFMLNNDLLIVVGALVGSSGAILSYIMCRAMNRSFISVIAGGFGTESPVVVSANKDQGQAQSVDIEEFKPNINFALVVGAEQYGISDNWFENKHTSIRIRSTNNVDSLNASTAAAIGMWELTK